MKKEILILVGMIALILVLGVFVMAVETPTTATATVSAFLSVTLTNAPVTFPNMDPGTTQNATSNLGWPLTLTINSVSNVNANVTTKANQTNFVSGSNTFAVSNMKWDEATTGPWTNYTISDGIVCSNVAPTSACNIYHQLTIPSAQKAGTYSTGITITATPV